MRSHMIEEQLIRRGITRHDVLEAVRRVPRHRFVPLEFILEAYADGPVSIGCGQTISQPYVVASMTEQLGLASQSRVLEIGTGSGYQTAILAEIAASVYTIELIPELSLQATALLAELGYRNINVRIGDGSEGWPKSAPFDAIIVTAAASEVPEALIAQLDPGGTMVIPVQEESPRRQILTRIQKTSRGVVREALYEVRFVPFVRRP